MTSFTFAADLWIHGDMPGTWFFVTLPVQAAEEIRATTIRRGFGSVRVRASIGGSEWETSVFPDATTGSFVLPVKAAIRRAEGIDDGSAVEVTITIRE